MEDTISKLKISKKSYALVFMVLLAFVTNGAAVDYVTQSIKHYALFNACFYALISVMVYMVFSDIITSPENMPTNLRKKLKGRLLAVVVFLMPLIAFVDMKAAMLEHNWSASIF